MERSTALNTRLAIAVSAMLRQPRRRSEIEKRISFSATTRDFAVALLYCNRPQSLSRQTPPSLQSPAIRTGYASPPIAAWESRWPQRSKRRPWLASLPSFDALWDLPREYIALPATRAAVQSPTAPSLEKAAKP